MSEVSEKQESKPYCIPQDREWPERSCDPCICQPTNTTNNPPKVWSSHFGAVVKSDSIRYGYECGPSVTPPRTSIVRPTFTVSSTRGPHTVLACMYALSHVKWEKTGFYDDTGRDENVLWLSRLTLALCKSLASGNFRPSNVVLYHLWERQGYFRMWQKYDELYTTILARENPTNAKRLAFEQYSTEVLRGQLERGSFVVTVENQDAVLHAFSTAFHNILSRGERWMSLVNAFESEEVLLMDQTLHAGNEQMIIGNVIDFGSDAEFKSLKDHLLDPENHLHDTCLRISGVSTMIHDLAESAPDSQIRGYLAAGITNRMEEVFGSVKQRWPDVPERRLLMIANKVQLDILSILGITINVEIAPTAEANVVEERQDPSTHLSVEEMARVEASHSVSHDSMDIESHVGPSSSPGPSSVAGPSIASPTLSEAFAGLDSSSFLAQQDLPGWLEDF